MQWSNRAMLNWLIESISDSGGIMKKLRKTKLGELVDFQTGPFGTQFSASEYVKEGIPVINVKNIGIGMVVEENLDYISEQTRDRLSQHILKTGDIVFGRKGSVDKHAYIFKNENGWVQGSDCIRARKKTQVNTLFLSQYLEGDGVKKQIINAAVGSTMPSLNTDILKDVIVLLPNIKEQNRISEALKKIDDKICLNNKINFNLEQQMHLIFENMMSKATTHKLPGKYTIAQNLTSVVTGKEDANFSVTNGKYKFFTCSNTPLLCDDYVFDSSSILIAGNGDFNVKHYSGMFNAYQRTYVLTPDKKYFALLYLASLYRINSFKSRSSGSIVKFITKSDVENIPVFIPNDISYLQELNKLIYLQEQNKLENELLIKLRDWLLPMLMNGQATISD